MHITCGPCVLNDFSKKCGVVVGSACKLYSCAGRRQLSSHPYPTSCLPTTQRGAYCYRHLASSSAVKYNISSFLSRSIMTRTGGASTNPRLNKSHNAAQRVRTYSQSQSRRSSVYRTSVHGSSTTLHLSWLYRSNIPSRRGLPLPNDVQKRNIFGMGEIIGVLANVREFSPT